MALVRTDRPALGPWELVKTLRVSRQDAIQLPPRERIIACGQAPRALNPAGVPGGSVRCATPRRRRRVNT